MMQSFWSKASELKEKAKNIAGDYLPAGYSANTEQVNNWQKEIEAFKKETWAVLDKTLKENEALIKESKENKGIIEMLEMENQGYVKENDTLSSSVNELKNKNEGWEREIKAIKKEIENNNVKNEAMEGYEKMKLDWTNFDVEYKEILEKLKKINEEYCNHNTVLSVNNNIIINNNTNVSEVKADNNDEMKENDKEVVKESTDDINNNNNISNTNKNNEPERKETGQKRRNKKGKNKKTQEIVNPPNTTEETHSSPKEANTKETNNTISNITSTENNIMKLYSEIETSIIDKMTTLINSEKVNFNNYIDEQITSINSKIDNHFSSYRPIEETNELKEKITSLTTEISDLKSEINKEKEANKQLSEDFINLQSSTIKEKEQNASISSAEHTKLLQQNSHLQEQTELLSKEAKTIWQTFKQFFLLLLEDDIFIDSIENAFNDPNSPQFFEKVYQLAKYIKPKIYYEYHKSFLLNNSKLISKLQKYNLETDWSSLKSQSEYQSIESIDYLQKYEISEDSKQDFIITLINELISYIDSLSASIISQTNKNSEWQNNIKSLEENKKKDIEKHLKLQNEIKEKNIELSKITKLNEEKSKLQTEIDSLNKKISNILNEKNDLNKDKNNFNDKMNWITQQCEVFKVENSEWLNQITESKTELDKNKKKIDALNQEITQLKKKTANFEQMERTLKDQDSQITIKDNEYKKLQTSYMELESFLEGSKKEKDISVSGYQSQFNEWLNKYETVNAQLNELQDKYNRVSTEYNTTNSSSKRIEELEGKLMQIEIENKSWKEQKQKLKVYSEEIVKRVEKECKDNEHLIDKRMISSILFKYFDPYTNGSIKMSLVETLANFMNYNNEERYQLGLPKKTGNEIEVTSDQNKDKLKKLGDELYDFILNS